MTDDTKFPNVLYRHDPCRFDTRYWQLLGMKRVECEFGRHLVAAVILGSVIGYERRGPDRPAGIRTMSLIGELLNDLLIYFIGRFCGR